MEYPKYTMGDLRMVPKDGTFEIEEFHNLIADLLDHDMLENDVEIGIAKYIMDNGTEKLSPKQGYVVNSVLERYCDRSCERCGLTIPLSEVIASELVTGGLCDYCEHMTSKED